MSTSRDQDRANWLKWVYSKGRAPRRGRRELALAPWMQLLETRQLMSIFTVTNTAESGLGSLRQAISDANGAGGADTIDFDIGGGGPATISPLSALPDITDVVTIDATTQPGFSSSPLIQIDGSLAGGNVDGLTFDSGASGSTIKGLIISDFTGNQYGILVNGATNMTIQGNWIGTNAAGTAAAGNGNGIQLINSSADLIGTDGDGVNDAAERNVISGNTNDGILVFQSSDNTIAGNYIGTSAAGTGAVGNGSFGVDVRPGGSQSNNNIIGTNGSNDAFNADERNIISANSSGVQIVGVNNTVAGNWIGLDVNGAALVNGSTGSAGITMQGTGGFIGTNADGIADTDERNVIDSNGLWDIVDDASGSVIAGNYIGTDPTGTIAISSATRGIDIGSNVTVGGTTAAQRNVIAGAFYGVYLDGSSNSTILGNYIGTDASGTLALPNTNGVYLLDNANSNIIGGATAGSGNVISGNTNAGVTVDGAGTISNSLLNNLIGLTADQSSNLPNSGGALVISNSAVLRAGGTFNGNVSDGGTLDLHGNNVSVVGGLTGSGTVNNNATTGAATLTVNGIGTFSGSIADGGAATTALTIAGGAETLTGSNGYSGPTTITAGTLQVGNGGTAGTLGSGTITDNGTLAYDYSNSINFTKVIGGSGTLSLTSTGGAITQGVAITVGSVVANAATGITLNGPGNTFSSFSATNSSSGAISVTDTSASLSVSGITQSGTTAGSNVTVNQTGALTISGAISTTATANGVISLMSSGPLTANAGVSAGGSGNLTLTGGSSSGNSDGVNIDGAIIESGTGAVLLQSSGGGITGSNNYGVVIQAGGVVETTGATGTVTLNGTGGGSAPSSFDDGVEVTGTGSLVTSGGGNVSITGHGGLGAAGEDFGIRIAAGGNVTAGGSGTVTLNGTGGGNGGAEYGVLVTDTGSLVTSSGGNVSITGHGGGNAAFSADSGVVIQSGAQVSAGGAGSVTVQGTGAGSTGGSNLGIYVSGATVTSGGGNVSITGTTVGGGTVNNVGVMIDGSGQVTAGGTGAVTVNGTGSAVDGPSAHGDFGVWVLGSGSQITSTGGNVSITGQAGSATTFGITVDTAAAMTAPGAKSVTLTATGASFGGINIAGTVSSTSGAVNLTAGNAITESSSGLVSTTGTLTTSSATGATLSGAGLNSVGTFNATNTTSGAISLTNTSTTLTVTGIIQSGTAAGSDVTINQTGSLSLTGAISTTAAANGNIGLMTTGNMTIGAGVTAGGSGNLNLIANPTGTTVGTFDGIDINGVTVQSTTGIVLVQGSGGSGTGSNRGVQTSGAAIIRTTGATGSVTINGTGGNTSTSGDYGVVLQSSAVDVVSTGGGNVSITGTAGGTGSSFDDGGVVIDISTVTAGGGGTVTINGTAGGVSSNNNWGVEVGGTVTSSGGNVSVTGTGGGNPGGASNTGVRVDGTITAGGTGTVTVTGTGGSGGNGVNVNAGAFITSTGGNIGVIAILGPLSVSAGGSVIAPGNDSITLTADSGLIGNSGTISSTSGAISATASDQISETGGVFSTTGTLTTSSADGQTLSGPNTIGGFSATNSFGGALSLTNTSTTLTVSEISEIGGTVTVNNTGSIAVTGAISAGAGNNVGLTATGALSESASGSVSTTGAGIISLVAGSTGIGAGGSPFVVSANNLDATTSGSGDQFLSATGSITIDATGLSAGTGTVELDGGTFTLGGSNRINDSTELNVNGATFAIATFSETVGTVMLTSGTVTGTTGVLTSTNTIETESGTVSAVLAGTNGLTQSTAGTTTLTGTNSYTGGTTISAGTLQVGNGGTTGTLGSGTITDNGTLAYDFSTSINLTTVVGGSGTLSLTSTGGAITQGAGIAVGGVTANAATGITLNGPGNAFSTFSAANSTSGAIAVTDTSTTLTITAITQSGSAAGSNITINQTGALTTTGTISTTAAASGAISLTSSAAMTVNAGISTGGTGNLSLLANQAGTATGSFAGLTVNGSGSVSTSGGNIVVSAVGGTSGGDGVLVAGGADVSAGGAGTINFTGTAGGGSGGAGVRIVGTFGNTAVVSSSGGSVTVIGTGNNDHGVDLTEGGQITGAAAGNTVAVTGTNASNGIGVYVVADFSDVSQISSAGGNVSVTGTGAGNWPGVEINGPGGSNKALITAGGTGAVTVTGIGGTGGTSGYGVQVAQRGVISSGGPVSVTGNGAPSAYGIAVGNGNSLPAYVTSASNAPVTLTADTLNIVSAGSSISAGSGTLTIQTFSAATPMNLGGADIVSATPTLGLSATELGFLTAGTLNIVDASGGITVSAAMSLPTPTVINLTAGGTNNIAFSGAGSMNSAGGNVNLMTLGAITSGTGTTDIFAGAGTVSIAGGSGIGSSGNPLVVSGTNLDATTSGNSSEFLAATGLITIDASGLNAGTGTVEFDAGTFALGGSNRINDSTNLNLNGATLAIGAFSETVATVTLTSGSITGATGVLTSTNTIQTESGTISAILAGTNGLTQSTAGTTTLSASNLYTGTTTINGGMLSVNGTITGAVTVGAAGTLAGNGSVGTVTNQGVVSPGNSPGILTINGNYSQSGALNDEIQGTNPVTPDFDQLIVNGTVSLGGALNPSLLGGFLPSLGNSFQMITNDGTDPVVGTFAGLPQGASFNVGPRFFTISYVGGTGNDVVISAAALAVTNTSDSGAGSLRQAILYSNAGSGSDEIDFGIPGSGVQTISPLSALPIITESVTVDGTSQPGYSGSPLIQIDGASSGGSGYGLRVNGLGGTTIKGLIISYFNFVTAAGIYLNSNNNVIQGDWIGTNTTGTGAEPNTIGIEINGGGNTIGGVSAGEADTIAFNTGDGVEELGGPGNTIRGNSMYANGSLAIDIGGLGAPLPNALGGTASYENFPVLDSVAFAPGSGTTVLGDINTTPNTTIFVDLYANPGAVLPAYGQGQIYLGSTTVTTGVDGGAQFTFNDPTLPQGAIISATATAAAAGNTSEFGLDFAEDNPPSAVFAARIGATAATTFNAGQTITFDASGSASPDSYPLTYSWDFGDRSSGTGLTATHAYAYDGTYVVTLTVNDSHGGIESTSEALTIDRSPLTLALNALPASVAVGTPLVVSGTVADPAFNPMTLVFAWGDGTAPTTLSLPAGATTFSAAHTFASLLAGGLPASITVTATDFSNPAATPPPPPLVALTKTTPFDAGRSTGQANASVSVVAPPVSVSGLSLSSTSINENDQVTLTGTIVDPYPLAAHTVTISWGDAPSAFTTSNLNPGALTFSANYRYLNNPTGVASGAFPILVTVTNNHGQTGTATGSVTVTDVAPTVAIETLAPTGPSSLISLFAAVTDPGTLDSHTYQWSVNGTPVLLATQPGFTFNPKDFSPASGGVYLVAVTVADDVGETGQANASILIGPSTSGHAIVLSPSGGGQVAESIDAQTVGTFTPGNAVYFFTNSTGNRVTIDPGLTLPAELVSTPGGSNTLVGGSGNDTLFSAQGLDTLIGTTGPTTFVLVLAGQDPVLEGSAGVNTIDLSQTPQDVTLNLGVTTPQVVDGGGDVVQLASGTFQKAVAGPGNDALFGASGVSTTLVGGAGNDLLYGGTTTNSSLVGGSGNATLVGGGGNSIIYGSTTGNSSVVGGSGNSTVVGGGGNSIIFGSTGGGSTSVVGGTGNATVVGGGGNSIIYGSSGSGSTSVVGGTGNSTVVGGGGNSVNFGSSGSNPTLVGGGAGNTTVVGGGGNSIIFGSGTGSTSVVGGTGNATVVGGGGNSIIYGSSGSGSTSVIGCTGNSTVVGGGGNSVNFGSSGSNPTLVGGGAGNTTVVGGGGNSIIFGSGTGSTSVVGGTGNSTVVGGGGNSIIYGSGSGGSTSVVGGTGNTTVVGGGGNSVNFGSSGGNPTLVGGGAGDTTVVGGAGNSIIFGSGSGSTSVVGGTGNATVVGGGGNSIIYGSSGSGSTSVVGGTGNSTVVGGGGNSVNFGSSGSNPTLVGGGAGNTTVVGGAGNSIIFGSGSGSTTSVVGGTGNATVVGGAGNSIIYGNSGGGNTSVVGGTGNSTVVGGGGNSVNFGSSGSNPTLVGGGAGNTTVVGGGGNSIIFGSGTGSTSVVGGTGNATVIGGGGNSIIYGGSGGTTSVQGGTGNATVVGGGGNSIIFGGTGSSSVVGGTGNATVVGGGGNSIIYGSSGGMTSVVGGSGNATVMGGGGNSIIFGSTTGTSSLVGGTGNATIVGGGGNSIVFGGTGNDSLVAGSGQATLSGGGGTDILKGNAQSVLAEQVPSNGGAPETVTLTDSSFYVPGFETETLTGFRGFGVTLASGQFIVDASHTSTPVALFGGTGNDTILAGSGDDSLYAGTGTDSLVGGSGHDTYVFGQNVQGAVTINSAIDSSATLDFSQFAAGINLDLEKTSPQIVSPGHLTLSITNPSAITEVVGTAYPDTIMGNGAGDTLIGNGGNDYLDARGGRALIEGSESQVVFLNFQPGAVDYSSQTTRDAIEARISAIYGDFNYTFTQTVPTSGPYAEIDFNVPAGTYLGGEATDLDFRNLSLAGSATVDISQFLQFPGLVGVAGLPAATTENIINMSATIAAHELGHLSGLLHEDAFGPIGTGVSPALLDNPNLDGFVPAYGGPIGAPGTPYDVMASPASVGSSLYDATQVTFFGERDAVKLAFADSGTTVVEATGTNNSPGTAQALTLTPLAVPNTLLVGQDVGATFQVSAVDVNGAILLGANGTSNIDYYAFTATAGQLFNLSVLSQTLTRDNGDDIDPVLTLLESDGQTIVPYGTFVNGTFVPSSSGGLATDDDSFQDQDSIIYDVTMPYTGTYYVQVKTFVGTDQFGITHDSGIGPYELFAYSFATTPAGNSAISESSTTSDASPAAMAGDTLIGGSGRDTLIGSSANDLIATAPGDVVLAGSGADTIDVLPTGLSVTGGPLGLTGSFVASNAALSYTTTWHVVSSNDQSVPDVSQSYAAGQLSTTASTAASFGLPSSPSGDYEVTFTVTDELGISRSVTTTEIVGTPLTAGIAQGGAPVAGPIADTLSAPITLSATAGTTYTWAATLFGASAPAATGSSSNFVFSPTTPGTYTVSLTASDAAGDVAQTTVTVIVAAPSVQILGAPSNLFEAEGSPFTLSSLVNNAPANSSLAWTITAGSGPASSPVTTSSFTYTPPDIGTYTVTLSLLDALGNRIAVASQQLIGIGVAPVASISGGPSGGTSPEGTKLHFSATAFSPSAPTMANGFFYEWTVTLGSFTYTTTTTTTLATSPSPFSFTPGQAGTYVVHLSAFDYHGFQGQDATQTVVVTAVPQSVTITGLPDDSTATLGSSLSLGASVTAATTALQNAGFVDSWTVQFGGATYGPYSGPNLNLTTDAVGVYTITLAAQDAEGVTASTTSLINVVDTAPQLSSDSSTQDATQGPSTEFALGTATGSSLSDGAGTVTVNWGDNTTSTFTIGSAGTLPVGDHTYALPGNYPVTVTVTDAFGMNATKTFTAAVAGVRPSPSILGVPSSVNAGSTVTLGSSVSDPSEAETALGFSYSWSVTKDGSAYTMPGNPATNLPSFTFQPTAGGAYVITLAVTDHDNLVGSTTASFTISQATPTVSVTASNATYSGSAYTGLPVTTVNGTVTTAGITYTYTALGSTTAVPAPTHAGAYMVTANYAGSAQYTAGSASANFTISPAATSVTGSTSTASFGSTTLVASVTSSAGTPAGSVDFYDSTTMIDLGSASVGSMGTTTLNLSVPLETGPQSIVLSFTSNTTDFSATSATIGVNQQASIYVMSPTASAALSVSGSSTVTVPGTIQVASSSPQAVVLSGSSRLTASTIGLFGGKSVSGSSSFGVTPTKDATAPADPLAGLPIPSATGMRVYAAVNLGGSSSLTIAPGIYPSINVGGSGKLTLQPGVYVITGGGFSISGAGSATGSGVMIYNAGSNYNGGSGNSFGAFALSGSGALNLAAPTSGIYAGIVVFQSRDNSHAMSVSGAAATGLGGGTIYAPAATLSLSGSTQVGGSGQPSSTLIVNELTLSGATGAYQLTDGSAPDTAVSTFNWITSPVLTVAAEDDTGTGLDPNKVADLSDAMAYLNQALGSFGVNLSWAAAGTTPDVTVHFATTTPEGGVPDGVLGYTTAQNDVYFVTGWNYSTSTDPTQVASDQFDFMTLAIHELGHTLGLGESQDPNSVMYEYLAPGTVRRDFTDSNLSLIDTDADRFMKVAGGLPARPGMTISMTKSAIVTAPLQSIGAMPTLVTPFEDAGLGRDLLTGGAVPGSLVAANPKSTPIWAPVPNGHHFRKALLSKQRVANRSNHADRIFSGRSIPIDMGFTSEPAPQVESPRNELIDLALDQMGADQGPVSRVANRIRRD